MSKPSLQSPNTSDKPIALPLLIALFYTLLLGALTGYGRFLYLSFHVGIQGMILGTFCGAITGRLLVQSPTAISTLGKRVRLALLLAVLYMVGQWMGISLSLPDMDPGFLLRSLLEGDLREVVTGFSAHSFSGFMEPVSSGWWVFFNLLDAGLFTFLAMAMLNVYAGKEGDASTCRVPAYRMVLIFGLLWAIPFATLRDFSHRNAADLARWYNAAWSRSTYLDLRLHIDGLLNRREDQAYLERQFNKVFSEVRTFPEAHALQALLLLRQEKMDQAKQSLDTAIKQCQGLGRPVTIDITRQVSAKQFEANQRHARAKIALGAKDLAAALTDLDFVIDTYTTRPVADPFDGAHEALEYFEIAPSSVNIPAAARSELIPYQTILFQKAGLSPAFTLQTAYLERAAVRQQLGDTQGAEEDKLKAQALQ